MKLIVGLGNPGPEYSFTPHNAGFLAVDRLAIVSGVQLTNRRGRALTAKAMLAGQEVLLARPETFMNLSGLSVAALLEESGCAVSDLIVLYDELAFPLGSMKLAERGSANGHNGVKSITGVLGTEEWMRIRIGVGKPMAAEGRESFKSGGKEYLLAPMKKAELATIDLVLDKVTAAVEMWLTKGPSAAMNEFNKKADSKE